MNDVWTMVNNMIWNLTHRLGVVDILDLLIMAAFMTNSTHIEHDADLPLSQWEESNGRLVSSGT